MNIVNALMDSYLDEEEIAEKSQDLSANIQEICTKISDFRTQLDTASNWGEIQPIVQEINKCVSELDVQREKLTELNNSLLELGSTEEQIEQPIEE